MKAIIKFRKLKTQEELKAAAILCKEVEALVMKNPLVYSMDVQ